MPANRKIQFKQIKILFFPILLTILCLVFGVFFAESGLSLFIEHQNHDLLHQLTGRRKTEPQVVIVTVDDETLAVYPDTPLVFWSPYFAKTIENLRLSGAAVVGLDYLFTISAESWFRQMGVKDGGLSRSYDIPMRRQLISGSVILGGNIVFDADNNPRQILPVRDYLTLLPNGINDVGMANLYEDRDGVVRFFMPALLRDVSGGMSLGALLVSRAKEGLFSDENSRYEKLRIGFSGPSGSLPRISMSRLLAENAKDDEKIREMVENRVVIIGAEHSNARDSHQTPYSSSFPGIEGRLMSGVEIHANIVQTLLSGEYPRELSPWFRTLFCFLFLFCANLLFLRFSPLKGAVCVLLLTGTLFAFSLLLFQFYLLLPAGGLHLSMALGYLVCLGTKLFGEEKKRTKLQKMFGRYVSDALVEKLVGADNMPDLGGEPVHVTILFSDIRNFTTISEKLSAHEVVKMLNAYFSMACEAILQNGGTVDKFIGDAIMAVFGAPVHTETHAADALRAAQAMRKTAEDFQSWMSGNFADRGLPEFKIGIGIHTGTAVLGNIGSQRRMEYTAIGDTVNLASRLESSCKELGWTIVCSEQTVKEAGNMVKCGRSDTIKVKGRTEAVTVFELLMK